MRCFDAKARNIAERSKHAWIRRPFDVHLLTLDQPAIRFIVMRSVWTADTSPLPSASSRNPLRIKPTLERVLHFWYGVVVDGIVPPSNVSPDQTFNTERGQLGKRGGPQGGFLSYIFSQQLIVPQHDARFPGQPANRATSNRTPQSIADRGRQHRTPKTSVRIGLR
ncbi:hypothetical protein SAMN05421805_108206 [Saccharopolyspora antimicrobica]|uniref:Uncharacterized protein n=1 Tax=Saccharopolyspora antimicrobica TaxID=455193 RepID=A0A1I5DN90_9PSEU|nr:hypothetical protein ATL45_3384 [Saccharopolyspora antimicrobica]SFO00745.1 hypothetical protein SAMN05421805_108206 [Saccharopolyspora antimicrobica]